MALYWYGNIECLPRTSVARPSDSGACGPPRIRAVEVLFYRVGSGSNYIRQAAQCCFSVLSRAPRSVAVLGMDSTKGWRTFNLVMLLG